MANENKYVCYKTIQHIFDGKRFIAKPLYIDLYRHTKFDICKKIKIILNLTNY